jgi:YesN/AraC family two-component response regulator
VESEDFDAEEVINTFKTDLTPEFIIESIKKFVPVIPPEKITHAANLLYACAKHLSLIDHYNKDDEIYEQQKQIGEYIQNMKASLIRESSYISYPYDKEKLLIHSIIHNDLPNSRKYLNEILGHIFFSSATNLEVIKVRAMELSVMISRAALDGGTDQSTISDINVTFISEFFKYTTIEEVCWSLTDILKTFTKETFEFSKVKHVDIISKAVAYVKANYMRKLTLNEVAEYVFLSPSYFSKIFKHETDCYFKDYVNYIRVEKSKLLLLTEKISLVEIADNAGFYDQSYFNKVFKKITGVTPKKFRETGGKAPLKDAPFRRA